MINCITSEYVAGGMESGAKCATCGRSVDDSLLCGECYVVGQSIDPETLTEVDHEHAPV